MIKFNFKGAYLKHICVLGGLFFVSACQQSEPTHYIERNVKNQSKQLRPPMAGEAPHAIAMAPGESTGKLVTLPFTYVIPQGWTELPPEQNKGMRARTFQISDSLECTFVLLGGQGGGLIQNLERWAKQLGLSPTPTDMEIFRSTSEVLQTQSQWKAEYFDFRKFDKKAAESIIAAIVPLGEQTLFVKLQGETSLVNSQVKQFKSIVTSLMSVEDTARMRRDKQLKGGDSGEY